MARQGGRGAFGPYPRGDRWVVLVRSEHGGSASHRSFATCDEATRFRDEARAALAGEKAHARTVGDAVDAFAEHVEQSGQRQGAETVARVRRFFADVLDEPIAVLTPRKCAALYDAVCARRATVRSGPRAAPVRVATDRPVSVATQRGELAAAKLWARWAVASRWLRASPLEAIKPRGRKRRGKAQLRIDETRAWMDHALALAPEEPGAVAALCALLMGMRAGEIVTRTARDLDDGARVLWIDETAEGWTPKTSAGRRAVAVPEMLRPHLLTLARGLAPGDLLFRNADGSPHIRGWILFWTRKICDAAGVPRVSAHGLRGTIATLAARAAPLDLVAVALGHTSATVTASHYAQPGAAEEGERARGLDILRPRDRG